MRCPDYVFRRIHILNNRTEEVTEQNYYFLRFKKRINAIDLKQSEWFQAYNRYEKGIPPITASVYGSELGQPLISAVRELHFKKIAKEYDFFNVANTTFQFDVCSHLFFQEVQNMKMKGVTFVPQEEIYEKYNDIRYNFFADAIKKSHECMIMHEAYLKEQGMEPID